ncbi:MAG: hypothetical protein U5K54_08130 [Cytophagales bacterium]|nr:hypothetical protein [Cytophagales bacterium]
MKKMLKENVFKPLRDEQWLCFFSSHDEQHNNVARPHYFSRKRWVTVPISDTYYNVAACRWCECKYCRYGLVVKSPAG